MKLPKIPKGYRIDKIRLEPKRTLYEISGTKDGVYLTGMIEGEAPSPDFLHLSVSPGVWESESISIGNIVLYSGLLELFSQMTFMNVRVNRNGQSKLTIGMGGRAHLVFPEDHDQIMICLDRKPKPEENPVIPF